MKINNVELEDLDIYDVEELERFETALEYFKDNVKDMDKFEKASEYMRYNCELIFNMFNDIFGEGTDKKIFGNKTNLLVCIKAVDELVTYVNENRSKQDKELLKITNKYTSRQRK